ncbi:aspartate kinase [Dellaglioa carnosa]|uniref:Aspartokinase n=1 Tax=Dellaglioa carnosa TaxID=2995136 RepID=A0ABT4JK53_9LACO|nr:aspartate kinase [Dellaglioa carnosa]MCZ2490751.1 aspartate kinase [Dellaglioa carnosa]MCZ2493829.1 aspartate kinase [Dellaglioa carnosa]MDK1730693.1 aspartate kinase [Dellaglioa carnosa]
MTIMVQKFGGTSVQDDESRRAALKHVKYSVDKGYQVVVVVSAIGRQGAPYATDSLLGLVDGEQSLLSNRELDMIVSVGETISAAVFSELLNKEGIKAAALTGQDAGVETNDEFQNAKVVNINTDLIYEAFSTADVLVVTGFQGATSQGQTTTIGRGGSDTTAALLGAALDAERVDIFTDVSGMMTADPRLVTKAKFLETVSYEEVANMAHEGAKVIHPRAVEIAQQAHVPVRIRSTWQGPEEMGTLVTDRNLGVKHYRSVTGIAHVTGLTQFTIKTNNHTAKDVFNLMADNHLSVDFINISPGKVIFNLLSDDVDKAKRLLLEAKIDVSILANCAKVSIVGAGMTGTPGVTSKIVTALAENDINILQTTDSYTTIWILVQQDDLKTAVNALHEVFLNNI